MYSSKSLKRVQFVTEEAGPQDSFQNQVPGLQMNKSKPHHDLWVVINGIVMHPNRKSNAAWLTIRCQIDALKCQNNALAVSLSSI
jgi:hypothetical protein